MPPDSTQLMIAGQDALKAGDLDEAQRLLEMSVDRTRSAGAGRRIGAFALLGKTLQKKGDYNYAMLTFERGVPDRECCKGAISIYRRYAKEAADHVVNSLRMYNKMLRLAHLYRMANEISVLHGVDFVDCDERIEAMMRQQRDVEITYESHGVPTDDRLLTKTDYAKMHHLTFGNAADDAAE